jgi:hypothetical protein
MIYKLRGQAVRRSKALAHAIDGMTRNHHAGDIAGYFATADSPIASEERDFARQVILDDSGVTFEESDSARTS